jgi:hypothetical protein
MKWKGSPRRNLQNLLDGLTYHCSVSRPSLKQPQNTIKIFGPELVVFFFVLWLAALSHGKMQMPINLHDKLAEIGQTDVLRNTSPTKENDVFVFQTLD